MTNSPYAGEVSGLPFGTSMKTTARVGPSDRAEPLVVWTAPDGSKNVLPTGSTFSA
jgi:hypothetical protein